MNHFNYIILVHSLKGVIVGLSFIGITLQEATYQLKNVCSATYIIGRKSILRKPHAAFYLSNHVAI